MNIEHRFLRDQGAATALRPHLNPLPRSVVRRHVFQLLDGEWRFHLDVEDRGLAERWFLGHDYDEVANWPGTIESQMAVGMEAHAAAASGWQDTVVAWYEREFEVPDEWLTPHSEVQVTFGACGYETRVWLNGQRLLTVEGEEVHQGEYTSFSYPLPVELLRPVNRLTVRVADSWDPDRTRGKQQSHVYKRGGIWYQTISGPVRSAWIEPVERNRLRTRLGVSSVVEERLVEFRLTTLVRDPGQYQLRLVVTADDAAEPIAMAEMTLPLEAGQRRQHVALELPGAESWSPENPRLYQMVAQLCSPDGQISQIEAHFGLRHIEARGRSIYLNGERLYLDGILYQPGTSTFEEIRRHMLAMKRLGCNLVRVHIAGIDPRIYELADEMGMLLWVEVPSPHRPGPASRAKHWDELQRLIVHIGSHPSVVILSLYNESWGAEDIAHSQETRDYLAHVRAYLRIAEPQLLVVDNDGWQHVSSEGRLESDLLTSHLYETDLDLWKQRLDRLVGGDLATVAFLPLVVGDPYAYAGQTPLVVSEWGGFGFQMYGGENGLDARAEQIRAFKREMVARPFAGDLYTQATSIEDETNGLIDPVTAELLVPEGILASPPRG